VFANRYTALIDACCLAGALHRNLLLTLAEADFFRIRWSVTILDETERAIADILARKGAASPAQHAAKARRAMEAAFEDADVGDFSGMLSSCRPARPRRCACGRGRLEDPGGGYCERQPQGLSRRLPRATEPRSRSADAFFADTIALDEGRAVAAIRKMRERFNRPALTAADLLLAMEAVGLTDTVDALRPHIQSL
jgi:hypothetical protein